MLTALARLLFPPKCIFCGSLIDAWSRVEICSSCFGKIPFTAFRKMNAGREYYMGCDGVFWICSYTGIIKSSLRRYKFHNKPGYFRAFGTLMADRIKTMTNYADFDIIIGVPLHKRRERLRGYNQSRLIAKAVSMQTGIPESSRLLARVRNTESQSLLDRKLRQHNVKDAFEVVGPEKVSGKAVLLIDDIMTTGYTLNECSKALKKAGAARVTAVVIASGRSS